MTVTIAAVDLGATSGRVVAGRIHDGRIDTEVVHRFANRPVKLTSGLHWNILELFSEITEGLRQLAQTDEIASIAVDGWAVDYALIRAGRVIGSPYHYRDDRSEIGVERVHGKIEPTELYRRNGLQFLKFNSIYQLASEPYELLDIADSMLMVPDLINFWLTGRCVTEITNASTTGLMHPVARTWDSSLIERVGLPRCIFGDLIEPGTTIAPTSAAMTARIGAPHPIPVVAVASHDTASAVIGTPLSDDRSAYVSCGTWSLVGLELPAPIVNEHSRAANFTNEAGADGSIRFLRNVMGMWMLDQSIAVWQEANTSVELQQLIAAAAELDTPEPIDVFDPRFFAPGDMASRIEAWCVEQGRTPPTSPAATTRLIIESLAAAFTEAAFDGARLADIELNALNVVGGGSMNELLCQRLADRARLPVIAGPVEATALGNIAIQARALGLVGPRLDDLRSLIRRSITTRRFMPTSIR